MEDSAKNPVGTYGPYDKPKGKASVVPDEPLEIFEEDNGDLDNSKTEPGDNS